MKRKLYRFVHRSWMYLLYLGKSKKVIFYSTIHTYVCLLFCVFSEQQQQQPFNGRLSGTTRVSRYQKKTFTRSHPSWSTYFLYHLSPFATVHGILFIQLTCLTVLLNNLFPGPLWSSPRSWTLNFILHAFLHPIIVTFSQHMPISTQPVLLQYQAMSSRPSLSLSSLLGSLSFSLTPHIHLTILISARWSATTFSFLTGQVSLPCNVLLRTQLLYNLPLIIKDTSLLVSSGTNCLNLFQPFLILASTAASASPSTLNVSPR